MHLPFLPQTVLDALCCRHDCCPQDLSPHTAASAAAFRATRSSRRLQRTWRSFASQRKTTAQLAHTFAALGVTGLEYGSAEADVPVLAVPPHAQKPPRSPGPAAAGPDGSSAPPSPGLVLIGGMSGAASPHHARFEDFAAKLQSPDTLRAAQVGCGVRVFIISQQQA